VVNPARTQSNADALTRSQFVRRAATATAVLGVMPRGTLGSFAGPFRYGSRAFSGDLSIVQWSHVVPGYDGWFDDWASDWGASHGVNVTVDHVDYTDLPRLAAKEAKAGRGHDIFGFLGPPSTYEDQVIDHRDVVTAVEKFVGPASALGRQSTLNPRTGKYFGVSDGFVPAPAIWRHDLWDSIGESPATWEHVLSAAPMLRELGHPIGIGLANEPDSTNALIGLMACFGSFFQDKTNRPTLQTVETIAAVEYMAAMFKLGGEPRAFNWTPTSNNQSLLGGKASMIINAISASRTADALALPFAKDLWLWPIPGGPRGRVGPAQYTSVYSIWEFAKNREAAAQFLIDFCTDYEKAVVASRMFMFPSFPGAMPPERLYALAAAGTAEPRGKYSILTTVATKHTVWTGYPGSANAAVDEALRLMIVPQMFARVARGESSASESVKLAAAQQKRIWRRARAAGRI
jgi:multiple sugar transport system substrate-binding protein